MPRVQYVGTSHFREFSASDFKSNGVEDQGKLVWDRDNRGDIRGAAQVHDVSDAVWTFLQEKESKSDFKLVDDPENVPPLTEDLDPAAPGNPTGAVTGDGPTSSGTGGTPPTPTGSSTAGGSTAGRGGKAR